MIEIQNGLVYQKTMMRARGASGAATAKSTKLTYPAIQRTRSAFLSSLGKSFHGFNLKTAQIRPEKTRPLMFLMN